MDCLATLESVMIAESQCGGRTMAVTAGEANNYQGSTMNVPGVK